MVDCRFHFLVCLGLVTLYFAGVSAGADELFRDRVLPPWTPVRVEGRDVHVWNRAHRFERGPLPASLSSAGENLLAAPIALSVVADSKAVEWTEGKRVDESPVRCVRSSTAQLGRLAVEAVTTVEFDGMIRVDLKLTPQPEAGVERIELRIPLRSEHAQLFTHNVIGTEAVASPRWNLRFTPERQWWAGAIPAEGWKAQFTPQVWLGTEERGLAWFSDTPAHWQPRAAANAIEIARNGKSTDLIIRFVQSALNLKGPIEFRFGLMATPVKPFQEPYRTLRIASSAAGEPALFVERFMKPGVWAADEVLSDLHGSLTVAAWAWLSEQKGTHNIFGGRPIDLAYDSVKKELTFSLMDAEGGAHSLSHPIELSLNRWYHLAASFDGERMGIWVDGKEGAQKAERFEFRSVGDVPFAVGANGWGSRRWLGKLDEVAIFRRALSAAEIAGLMERAKPADAEQSLAAYWDFEQEPKGLVCAEKVALVFRPPKDASSYSPRWVEGRLGKAVQLVGDYAEVTGNREGLTGFEYLKRKGVDVLVLWNNWSDIWGYPGITDERYKDFLRRFLAAAHQHGIRVIPYISIGIMMENEPEAAQMVDKVARGRKPAFRRGEQRGYMIEKNLAWAEYYSAKLAQFAREFEIDGIYMDGGGLEATLDTAEADSTPAARQAVSYSVFTGRELMRRCYAIFHGGIREGFVLTHDSAPPIVNQDAFTDVLLSGELHEWVLLFRKLTRTDGAPLLSRFPLPLTRAWLVGDLYGVPTAFCAKHRTKDYTDGKRTLLRGAILTDDEISAAMAVHGIPIWSTSPLKYWTGLEAAWWQALARPDRARGEAGDGFGRDGATWHPYWRNAP
ncbi:MAG: hypothetical protein FJ278_09590, partial [Planctomycetes bacterium]|nr:hypothetical protein [Planctomycetota bacterium]